MEFGEMKWNTSNWSNFWMLLRRAGLTASAGLSCFSLMTGCAVAQALCWRRHIIPMGVRNFFTFFLAHPWRSDPPTDFGAKWLKRRALMQGCAFCCKNHNFSYPLISRAPKRSKFRKFLDLENFALDLAFNIRRPEREHPLFFIKAQWKWHSEQEKWGWEIEICT